VARSKSINWMILFSKSIVAYEVLDFYISRLSSLCVGVRFIEGVLLFLLGSSSTIICSSFLDVWIDGLFHSWELV